MVRHYCHMFRGTALHYRSAGTNNLAKSCQQGEKTLTMNDDIERLHKYYKPIAQNAFFVPRQQDPGQ